MTKYDRRSFLKASAAVTVASGFVLPRFSIGQSGPSANSKLNVAMIGAGNVAHQALGGCDSENIVALCDVDSSKLYQHADKYPRIKQAATFSDYRVMLDKMDKQIDGEKTTGFTDERSNNARLVNLDEMRAFNKAGLPAARYPRVQGGPIKEWVNAIKGGPLPGSNFDYAAPMTETMLLGVIAVNHGGKIEWDSKNMKITNRPELNVYLKDRSERAGNTARICGRRS